MCLIRIGFYTGSFLKRFFCSWTAFCVTTGFLAIVTFLSDQYKRKSIQLNLSLLENLVNQEGYVPLDQMLFREDILRIPHVPMTVSWLAELSFSTLLILFDRIIPMIVMGYREFDLLPSKNRNLKQQQSNISLDQVNIHDRARGCNLFSPSFFSRNLGSRINLIKELIDSQTLRCKN